MAFTPSKGSGAISYEVPVTPLEAVCKGNVDTAVTAERRFYSQFVLKNAASKEELLIISKDQQHTLHSKSLFHMLFLFSWLLPSTGHYLLPLTTALLLLPGTASPFPTQNEYSVARSWEGSTPTDTECPDGS